MKLNCTFITPYREKANFDKFKTRLEKTFKDIQVIGIEGTKDSSFFKVWREALPLVTKKYVCLTHDDTEYIGLPDLDKYFTPGVGMIGTAGTTILHKDQPWWFSEERYLGHILSGQIWNNEEDKKVSRSIFGDFGEVVALDGVCMITTKKILEDVGIPIKDYGTFDFYDEILSLEYLKKGYKILTVPIVMIHGSKGGNKRDSFYNSLDKFKDEYLENKTWRV